MNLDEAIQAYVSRLEWEKKAETSIRSAWQTLDRFHRWYLAELIPVAYDYLNVRRIEQEHIEEYFFMLRHSGIAASSYNRYRAVFNNFFEYTRIRGWMKMDVMEGIRPAGKDMPKRMLILSPEEMLALLDGTTHPVERVALAIGMNTALRGTDILNLRIFDVQLSTSSLSTEISKTKELDIKPITVELREELERWLDEYAERMLLPSRLELPNDWLLVPSITVLPSGTMNIFPYRRTTHPWRMVQRGLERLSYPTKGEGFHTLRRSSARALFEMLREGNGRDHALMIVKDYLNHKTVAQTERYLQLNEERERRNDLLRDQRFLTSGTTPVTYLNRSTA